MKEEFVSPWGICDFAGIQFNLKHVQHRLGLRQKKAVTSITRAALLLQVPDVEDRRSISVDCLAKKFSTALTRECLERDIARLQADGFLVRTKRGTLQKRNGWMPLQDRIVAVEAKLARVEEALQQARANLGFAAESYVALPIQLARRVAADPSQWEKYFDLGIGLIGVASTRCELFIDADINSHCHDPAVRLYCAEKFWNEAARSEAT
ncbi:hypothetical protein [Rosistilla carotiformis]|uniref:hypothetical protein n=1 Tax=Rosistilla carotiformis TaxID=2528017 RepID=UPI0018D24386|nr:hypothetical protein [Rosistilla carotiformis]